MQNIQTNNAVLNPMDRYKFTPEQLAAYEAEFTDYTEESDEPIIKSFKVNVHGAKNVGKTHFVHSAYELHPANPTIQNDPLYAHVKFLLENNMLTPGAWVYVLDGEGKDTEMNRGDKFKGKPIKVKDIWFPDSNLPTFQNANEYIKEVVKFLKMLASKAEGTGAFETSTMLTTQIQNFVQYQRRDSKIQKQVAEKSTDIAPLPEMAPDDWGWRNSLWEYIGGFIQRLLTHFILVARIGDDWQGGKPTDSKKIEQYKRIPGFMNVVVELWRTSEDTEDGGQRFRFWGRITDSDFMEPGLVIPVMENPSFLKVIAEVTKFSHKDILEKHGFHFPEYELLGRKSAVKDTTEVQAKKKSGKGKASKATEVEQ